MADKYQVEKRNLEELWIRYLNHTMNSNFYSIVFKLV